MKRWKDVDDVIKTSIVPKDLMELNKQMEEVPNFNKENIKGGKKMKVRDSIKIKCKKGIDCTKCSKFQLCATVLNHKRIAKK